MIGKLFALSLMVMTSSMALAQTAPVASGQPIIPMEGNNDTVNVKPEIMVNPSIISKPVSAENTVENVKPVAGIIEMNSMLFSPSDIKSIYTARALYEQTLTKNDKGEFSEDDFLKKLEKVTTVKLDGAPDSFTYPQFFLSLIVYYSPEDWVVWINDEKITKDTVNSAMGISVIGIDKEKVAFAWSPSRMDKIVDVGSFSIDNPVKVDTIKKQVAFVLKPNQTFSSYAMRVVEGKVVPVTINNTSGQPITTNH